MTKLFLGILIGIVIENTLGIVSPIPGLFSNYFAVIIGAFLAGYIACDRGWLAGLIVGVTHAIFAIWILIAIGRTTHAQTGVYIPMITPTVMLLILSVVPVGSIAGALGGIFRRYYLRRKTITPKEERGHNT